MTKKFCTFVIDSDTLRDYVIDDWRESPINELLGWEGTETECRRLIEDVIDVAEEEHWGLTNFEAWFEDRDYIFDIGSIISEAVEEYITTTARKIISEEE